MHPRARFFLLRGPINDGSGRAWWPIATPDRPKHVWFDEAVLPKREPSLQLARARALVQAALGTIKERYAPDALVLGGASQGAMLALDVALTGTIDVDRVAALSSVLLEESFVALRAHKRTKPPVFFSHGRQDRMLPFRAGSKAKELLERHGIPVRWCPFDGGHEIPSGIMHELREFLFAA
jgi:phospholipase/carboxylesterase